MSVNKIILLGNVGRDPEVRATTSGETMATFSLATSYGRGDSQQTEWHRVVAWRQLADVVAQYVHKGRKLYVEGRVQSRKYTDKDGVERTMYEVVANQIDFVDKAGDVEREAQSSPVATERRPMAATPRPAPRPAPARPARRAPTDDELLDSLSGDLSDMDVPF